MSSATPGSASPASTMGARVVCVSNCTFELSLMRTFDAFSTTQFDPMWTIVLNVQERIRRVSEKVEGPQDDPIYLYFYRCHSW